MQITEKQTEVERPTFISVRSSGFVCSGRVVVHRIEEVFVGRTELVHRLVAASERFRKLVLEAGRRSLGDPSAGVVLGLGRALDLEVPLPLRCQLGPFRRQEAGQAFVEGRRRRARRRGRALQRAVVLVGRLILRKALHSELLGDGQECAELLLRDVHLAEVHEVQDALQVLKLDPAQVDQRLDVTAAAVHGLEQVLEED